MYSPDKDYIVLFPSEEEQWVKEGLAHAVEIVKKHTSSKSDALLEPRQPQRLQFGTDGTMVYPVIILENK